MNATNSTAERPSILTAWRAQREADRTGVRNATDSALVMSGDPAVLELFGTNRAASGMAVTADSAMRVSAVYACVRLIAGAVATLPFHIYERTKDGRSRVEDASLWWLLNEQPTARFSAAAHWEYVVAQMLLRGDAFSFIRRNVLGEAKELIPLPWSAVEVQRFTPSDGSPDRLKYFVRDVRTFGVDQDDMLHFPGFGFDGCRGMSVIQSAARNAAGNAMAMDEYSGRFFANGAHASIVLETEKKMSDTAITNLQTAFGGKYSGVENSHRLPLVLTEGLTAKEISVSAEDAQLLDARKFQVVDIARAFGVPPHMIGETSGNTSYGAGLESMSRGFVTFTLQPPLVRVEQELNRKLYRTSRRFVECSRDALLEGDSKAQADYFKAALGGPGSGPGWMKPNDIRRIKNMPPEPGLADKLYDPRDAQAAPTKGNTGNEDPKAPAAAA